MARGANVNESDVIFSGAKNAQGKTALDLAREHGNTTAEKALLVR